MNRLMSNPLRRQSFFWGWLLILPTMIGLIVLNIIPLFYTVYQSFHQTGDFGTGNEWVGLENYRVMFEDREVLQSIINTVLYMVCEVPISIGIALVLAAMLSRRIPGRTAYRMIYFLPMVVAPAAVAMVWRWLYNAEYGLINNIFGLSIRWVTDPNIAIFSIAIIGIWSIIGYNMILFIAALQEVPRDYYEAAEIDGIGPMGQFWYITLPLISPTIFFVVVTRVIAGLQVFDLIYMVIDRNNPALFSTQSLVYLFYRNSFVYMDRGYGAAIVVLLLLITLALTGIQSLAQKRWVHYN